MDEYYDPVIDLPSQSQQIKELDRADKVGIEEWGTTTNPFEHQTQALKARIFHGANRVEFAFFGAGKGRKEQATPESFGRRDRMDMRELAEFNEVETTTHATVGVSGLSGLDMQQGIFDDRHRKESIDEIKRAIHFAAEATTGGAIVFHSGEAPRSMRTIFMDEKGEPVFEMYPEEKEREQFFLADPVTKRINPIRRNDRIAIPDIETDEKGNYKYLLDENGKEVVDPILAKHDPIHKGRIPIFKLGDDGSVKAEVVSFNEWIERRKKEYEKKGLPEPDIKTLTKDFYKTHALNQVQYNINFYRFAKGDYEESLKTRDKIVKSLKFYKELKKRVPEDEWWKFKQQDKGGMFIPPDVHDPVEYLEVALARANQDINRHSQLDLYSKRQAIETLEMAERMQWAPDFALNETSKSIAELGIYTWQMNEKSKREGQGEGGKLKLKNDLYIAPENVFPEAYGSHPDELKNLILKGREEMVKRLKSTYKMEEKEAKKIAEKHIKATFDIGHANIWRKYFVSKEGESLEDRDKRFNKWLLNKTKELIKEGIIGHIHVSDNFGFHDEHLTAMDGNAPIKEFIQQAKASGLKEFIIESGSFNPLTSLPDTWMFFDSPVYSIHVPGITRDRWTDIYRSYFGRTEGPRYIVGDYSPSEDFKGSPFYSGLGME